MANTTSIYTLLTTSREEEEFQAARFDCLLELSDEEERTRFSNWVLQIQSVFKGAGEVGAKFLAMRVIDHCRKSDTARQDAKLYGEQLRAMQK